MSRANPLYEPLKRLITSKKVLNGLAKLGIETVRDLMWNAPRRVYRWNELTSFASLESGAQVTLYARVLSSNLGWTRRGDKAMLTVTVSDEWGEGEDLLGTAADRLTLRFFAKTPYALKYHAEQLRSGTLAVFAGRLTGTDRPYLANPQYEVVPGGEDGGVSAADVVRAPVPVYSATAGLPSWQIASTTKTIFATLDPADFPDTIPPDVRARAGLLDPYAAISALHEPKSLQEYQQAIDYLKYEEALMTQAVLVQNRHYSRTTPSPQLRADEAGPVARLIGSLPFELTPGQQEVWKVIGAEIASDQPMMRLLQGDVGSGKTILSLLALTQCVEAGYQGALLAPTSVLAEQHFQSALKFLAPAFPGFPPVVLLTSRTPAGEARQILSRLEAGEPMIAIGTHAILSRRVKIPRLGLAVVDEQHRFGVAQRDQLRQNSGTCPHLLVMTATPIPRTAAMTIFGDLDILTLTDMPPGRAGIQTVRVPMEDQVWMRRTWERAAEEIAGGGRVYVLCPKISADTYEDDGDAYPDEETRVLHNVVELAENLQKNPVLDNARIGILHGSLPSPEKTRVMDAFATGDVNLLVCTTVVEVGVDVPAATMMVIMDADRFGLATLHQLRGRVGRGSQPGLCLAVAPAQLPTLSLERLEAFAKESSGFALAQTDLLLRREGDVLGSWQSGGKSSLKMLHVIADAELISKAREEAEKLIEASPDLTNFPDLAREISLRVSHSERESIAQV